MKIKYFIFALVLCCAPISWCVPPQGWVGPSNVLSISSIRWYGILTINVSPPSPGNDCNGLLHLEVPATSENLNVSIMLSAMSIGKRIKVHYIGNGDLGCRVDAVQLCAEESACPVL